MKKFFLMSMMMLLIVSQTFTSCGDDDTIPTTPLTLNVELPLGIENVVFSNTKATFTNITTNEVTTVEQFTENADGSYSVSVASVPEGSYNVEISGDLSFTKDGVAGTTSVSQKSENVAISATNSTVKMAVNTFTAQGGFVISEIYFKGTRTPEDKSFFKDQYVIISNNSDVTLYADSIAFVESSFTTVQKRVYTPDIMNDYMTVQAIYMIPGTGKEVAVEPGKSLVLALNAQDHTEANANSFDLSKADFEFYDVSAVASQQDIDNQSVPNLDKWYCYSNSYFMLNSQGNKAYAIARMHQSMESFLADNAYTPTYIFVNSNNGTEKEMKVSNCLKLSNQWILDAVNIAPSSKWEWNVTSASLDAGYTYCGTTATDKNAYNKAVIRKTTSDGKWVDTNNSSNDFEADATPSYLKK